MCVEDDLRVCMICARTGGDGIHILSRFICSDCEQDLVNTEVDDDLYEYFVDRLRILWNDLMSGISFS